MPNLTQGTLHVLCDKKHRILADTSRSLTLAIDQKGMPEEFPKNDGILVKIQSRNCPQTGAKGLSHIGSLSLTSQRLSLLTRLVSPR